MQDTVITGDEANEDPQPRFPTDADLALAERLRRKIEERYLGHPANPVSPPAAGHAGR